MQVKERTRRGETKKVLLPETKRNEFFRLDYDLCISCGRCTRAVDTVQLCDAMVMHRDSIVPFPLPNDATTFEEAGCVGCGICVSECPNDALIPLSQEPYVDVKYNKKETTTICGWCGVGCEIKVTTDTDQNKIVKVDAKRGLVNDNMTCVKGKFGLDFSTHKDRLNRPLIRKNGEHVPVSWDEAFDYIEHNYKRIFNQYSGEAFGFLSSAKCTNEENYLMQKFARVAIKTNNVDHCARLCHASTVTGLLRTLGSGAMTNSIEDLTTESDVIFVIGSNTTEAHPVIGTKIRQSVHAGKTKLIVADPRRIELADLAAFHLQQKPGTDLALINCMMKVIIDEELIDEDFIRERTEGFDELKRILKTQSYSMMEKVLGIPLDDIKRAARMYATANTSSIIYAMGITQHFTGTYNVAALANLAMMTGQIGRPGAGVNPLRGQNNVQGACDLGGLPNVFTGYKSTKDEEAIQFFEDYWDTDLTRVPGSTVTEIMDSALSGRIKALHIMGENPALSDPNTNEVRKALDKLDFLVVQDLYLTETAEYADVVLPALSFLEKDGTFTNTERRVQRIQPALTLEGERKADWVILNELLRRFGVDKQYADTEEIFEEIRGCTPIYAGMSYDRIEEKGLQWPCPDEEHPGTPILHTDTFARGKGKFLSTEYIPASELPDDEYPLILTTGRSLYHFHTGSMSRRSQGLNERSPHERTQVSIADAEALGIETGDKIRISSRRGTLVTEAKVTDRILEGVVFMTFHFKESAANLLTNDTLDPYAKIPELKVAAINIEKIDN